MPKYPDPDMLQGTLDMLILKTVASGPIHGYGIAMRISRSLRMCCACGRDLFTRRCIVSSGNAGSTTTGAPRAAAVPNTILTKQGQQLATETENWDRLSTAVNRLLQTT